MIKKPFLTRTIVLVVEMVLFSFLCISMGFSSMGKWKTYSTPHLHSLNDLWFKGERGVVAGYYQSLDDLVKLDLYESLSKQEAIILYKQNAKSDWRKVYSGIGDILQLYYNAKEEYLYALGRKYFPDGQWKAFLLLSKDFGNSWKELSKPPEKTEGISFAGNRVAYAWSVDQVYRSVNGAQTWESCKNIEFKLQRKTPILTGGNDSIFWYASQSSLFVILPDGQVQKEALPSGFKPKVLTTDSHHDLWLLGKSEIDQKLLLLKRTDAGKFDSVSSIPYFLPGQLYVGITISIITGTDLKNLPPPEGVMLRSRDGGKRWKPVPKLPDGTKVFFEGDKAIWQLGTMDRLQRLVN